MTVESNKQETNSLLDQVLMSPSNELITDRFSPDHQAAANCSGICSTGTCKGVA